MSAAPEKCPPCGEPSFSTGSAHKEYACFTVILAGGRTIEGWQCSRNQRDQLEEKVGRLIEAGDVLAEIQEGPAGKRAIERWNQAKGQP